MCQKQQEEKKITTAKQWANKLFISMQQLYISPTHNILFSGFNTFTTKKTLEYNLHNTLSLSQDLSMCKKLCDFLLLLLSRKRVILLVILVQPKTRAKKKRMPNK